MASNCRRLHHHRRINNAPGRRCCRAMARCRVRHTVTQPKTHTPKEVRSSALAQALVSSLPLSPAPCLLSLRRRNPGFPPPFPRLSLSLALCSCLLALAFPTGGRSKAAFKVAGGKHRERQSPDGLKGPPIGPCKGCSGHVNNPPSKQLLRAGQNPGAKNSEAVRTSSQASSPACTRAGAAHAKRSIRTLMARSSIMLLASRSIAASASAWLAKRTVPKPLSTAQVSQRPLQQGGEAGAGKMHGRVPMQRRGNCLRSTPPRMGWGQPASPTHPSPDCHLRVPTPSPTRLPTHLRRDTCLRPPSWYDTPGHTPGHSLPTSAQPS